MDTTEWTEVRINQAEAACIMRHFLVAEGEGMMDQEGAAFTLKLIRRFGPSLIPDHARGWFERRLLEMEKPQK